MKKVLKISTVLVLACALILGMGVKVSAAGSKTDLVEITSATKDGEKVDYKVEPVADTVDPLTEAIASKELAAKNVKTIDASGLKVLWQKDVTAPAGTKFAFSVTDFDGQPVYAFHWNAETKNWDYVDKGTAPSLEITFPDLSPIGLVVELPAEPTPETGDNSNITLWIGVMAVAAAGAVGTMLYSKKRKNEA